MSFEEKSTWAVLAAFVVVYGGYFLEIYGRLGAGEVDNIEYKILMGSTVVTLIVVTVVTHIVIAILAPDEADRVDERDRNIDIRGEYVGSFAVSLTALAGIALALAEMEYFWVANALLLGLVLAEILTNCTKLWFYRRGY